MIQHTAESGRGASPVRWEMRPSSAVTDRLGMGYLLEPADGPVFVPVAADRHLVAWRGRASGEPVQLAVSVTSTSYGSLLSAPGERPARVENRYPAQRPNFDTAPPPCTQAPPDAPGWCTTTRSRPGRSWRPPRLISPERRGCAAGRHHRQDLAAPWRRLNGRGRPPGRWGMLAGSDSREPAKTLSQAEQRRLPPLALTNGRRGAFWRSVARFRFRVRRVSRGPPVPRAGPARGSRSRRRPETPGTRRDRLPAAAR